ncbi:MAG: cyclic nucleotide-binding domain-containing protein [Bacteroidetes bacterium]|nr:cyclic nucleotide-binding domain-containing protein [Bacteroidota bacterium]
MHFADAEKYIIRKLEKDLPKNLYYHGVHHTIDVCNAAARLAKFERLSEEDTLLLKTAALYHDCGFLFKYYDNEALGVTMMRGTLETFGYTRNQINTIAQLILATSIPHKPQNLLEKLICDADLDYLGRDDFFSISHSLKREWSEYGKPKSLLQWYTQQLDFMQKHRYFTQSAIALREANKQKYIEEIKILLGKLNKENHARKSAAETRLASTVRTDIALNKVEILKHVDIFSTTSENIVTEIAAAMKVMSIPAGTHIIEKGELGTCMYIIDEGKVKVHDGIYDIAELSAGKFFGEISLLDTEPRSADVTAVTDCVLLQLDQEDFSVVSHKYNDVARGIMRVLLGRLRSQNTKIIQELKEREKHLHALVDERTRELNLKNEKLEAAYKDIKDSISYAKLIQQALLPNVEDIFNAFTQSFIYYRPKDIVSGDFYFFEEKKGKYIVGVADCTGHGVPGAFMSMIGHDTLHQIIVEKEITTPSEVLNQLEAGIRRALHQDDNPDTKDGMDIAVCALDAHKQGDKNILLQYSGALRSLYLVRKDALEVEEVRADKHSIGGLLTGGDEKKFSNHQVYLNPGDTFYIFSDGYCDQFGGPGGKKFMNRHFQRILLGIQQLPMKEQEEFLDKTFREWKGDLEQVDDVLVIGIRI